MPRAVRRVYDEPITKPLPRINECEAIIDAMEALAPTKNSEPLYRQIGARLSQLCYGIQDIDAVLRGQSGTSEGGLLTRLEVLEKDYANLNKKVDDLLKTLREFIKQENARHERQRKEQAEREAGRKKTRTDDMFGPSWFINDVFKPLILALVIYFLTTVMPKLFALIK